MHKYTIFCNGRFVGSIYAHHAVFEEPDFWKFYTRGDSSSFDTAIFTNNHIRVVEDIEYYKNYIEAMKKIENEKKTASAVVPLVP